MGSAVTTRSVVILSFLVSSCLLGMPERSFSRGYAEGELLIRFKPGVPRVSREAFHRQHGLRPIRKFANTDIHHIRVAEGMKTDEALKRFKKLKDVAYAVPNHKRSLFTVVPNDPYWTQQWGMEKIRVPDVWAVTHGDNGVKVAILDTGVAWEHPDLAANMWTNPGETDCSDGIDNDGNGYIDDCRGWNFWDDNNSPSDGYGHGTHVAGVIGAAGNNGIGVAGVNWNVGMMPVKFMGQTASGEWEGYVSDEIAAIEYAVKNGARVINASFGCEPYRPGVPDDCVFNQAEYDAIEAAGRAGVLFVAAAGNNGTTNDEGRKNYPSSYDLPNLIAVAATDEDDSLAVWSNHGQSSVHLAASGVDIRSTYLHSGYHTLSGTSMATPFVSGVAALMLAAKPDATVAELRDALLKSVDIVPALEGRVVSGGRLNAFRALLSLRSMIVLRPGWNLISLPVQPTNPAIASTLGNIAGSYQVIWAYPNQVWTGYDPRDGEGSTLTAMEAGRGYWIKMTEGRMLPVEGSSPSSGIPLLPGWNLMGCDENRCRSPASVLSTITGRARVLWGYEGQSWKAYDPKDATGSTLTQLCPGNGYWINIDETGTWGAP